MPDNGEQNGSSRLDRIEAALEAFIGEHEVYRAEHEASRAEHKMLPRAQVLLQDSMEKHEFKMAEITDKLNGLIGAVDEMRQNFDARLKRLEGQ